jgi:hypothetical protein
MKSIILSSLFIVLALFFFQSCGDKELEPCDTVNCAENETCIDGLCIDTTCCFCGAYDGLASGTVEIQLSGTDTTFTDLPVALRLTRVDFTNDYIFEMDISLISGAPMGTLIIDFNGTLQDSTITFPLQQYQYSGLMATTLSGALDYFAECDSIRGNIQIVDGVSAAISFRAINQF